MYKVISFGHRCSTVSFIEKLNLKTESYPFDWLVSKLDVIKHCIETNFVHFTNPNNYVIRHTETVNMIDNTKTHICNDEAHISLFYETNPQNNQTYAYKLALNHRNIKNDLDYYHRCIHRLYELFKTDIKKYFIYFHPIIGINDFHNNKENILNDFENFTQYIASKTTHIFGIYFILIRHNAGMNSITLKETNTHKVFVIYCNDQFLDGGAPFMGIHDVEQEEVLTILRSNLK